ncbi:MAG: anthranilate synthase component I, partial [Kiritimatiellae bacterium]|nr:anthranilate synthase component I [Kiritimatiellia bacterium]
MTYVPDKTTFLERAKRGNLVPVWRELLVDQETPVSAYCRLRAKFREKNPAAHTFLLESVEGGEKIARYSFLGGNPFLVFRATGRTVEIETADGHREFREDVDPMDELRSYMARYQPVEDPDLPLFYGGAVGYLGYPAITQFEPRVGLARERDIEWPDMVFVLTDTLLIFDHVRHTAKVVANARIEGDPEQAYNEAMAKVDEVCEALTVSVPHHLLDLNSPRPEMPVRSNLTQAEFEHAVEAAKEYIRAGDI